MTSLCGGRADAADSKSVGLKTMRVQVPPPAQEKALRINILKAFLLERTGNDYTTSAVEEVDEEIIFLYN